MDYIDFNRYFLHVKEDEKVDPDEHFYWGLSNDSLTWPDLLKKKRVVLLAEAGCGKTKEFKVVTGKLNSEGNAAFFLRIEELADDGIEASLDYDAINKFEAWKYNTEIAYFFLDSIDEARLNQKSFEKALRKLGRAIKSGLDRCHIFISCRKTDWRGHSDLADIKRYIPILHPEKITPVIDPDNALLDPIFSEKDKKEEVVEQLEAEITIVRLAPLETKDQLQVAERMEINAEAFKEAISKKGLDSFTERPMDIINLAEYWKDHKKFDTLTKMTEFSLKKKLEEHDKDRADNIHLSLKKALEGSEIIAAALTLGKSFTLKAGSQEENSALDARLLLTDWSDAECNALLRKGIFAPATYGRIRFHHRSSQEFLTAKWLFRLLKQGASKTDIFHLLFAEPCGVKCVIPSMQVAAAWLANWCDDICEEVLQRNPLILILHGDPTSLSISIRERLLKIYAEKYEVGDVSYNRLGLRTLWMFAHDDLSNAIHEAWQLCQHPEFREDLLWLIHEGNIPGCIDIAIQALEDVEAQLSFRRIALIILINCEADSVVFRFTQKLLADVDVIRADFASSFALELFPKYLNVEELILLITKTLPPEEFHSFGFILQELWEKCPKNWRMELMEILADLSLEKPFVADYRRISEKYRFIAKKLMPIGHELVRELGSSPPPSGLIRLLMAIERGGERSHGNRELKPTLCELIKSNPQLQQALFWADVKEVRENDIPELQRISHHDFSSGVQLCDLTMNDLFWLKGDLSQKSSFNDKQIALCAILDILKSDGSLLKHAKELRHLVSLLAEPTLIQRLENYLNPHLEEESDIAKRYRIASEKEKIVRTKQTEKNKQSWIELRDELINDPSIITTSKSQSNYTYNLTQWLEWRTGKQTHEAQQQWELLTEGFDNRVSEFYLTVMKKLWRETAPEFPIINDKHTVTWEISYAYGAIGIEASVSSDWVNGLSDNEVIRAAQHACISMQMYPDWLDQLIDAYPKIVAPIVIDRFRKEWCSEGEFFNSILSRFRYSSDNINSYLLPRFVDVIVQYETQSLEKLDGALRVLQKAKLSEEQANQLTFIALNRFNKYLKVGERDIAIRYLALSFNLIPTKAMNQLEEWLISTPKEQQKELAEIVFSVLFDQYSQGLSVAWMANAEVLMLKQLLLLAYRYIPPEDDVIRSGHFNRDSRDNAQSARNSILSSLINAQGEGVYHALVELADTPEISSDSHRFHQLARAAAEKSSERPARTESDVLTFHKNQSLVIKSGDDLYRVIQNVLEDIRHQLDKGDVSSKRLLSKLAIIKKDDESSVQNWLADQLRLRSNYRYSVSREAEVAECKRPDIIITVPGFEVAIEVKQADSWSSNELMNALTKQLSEDYLKSKERRHGILFMSDHGRKKWAVAKSFSQLVLILENKAKTIKKNDSGDIKVSVFGLSVIS